MKAFTHVANVPDYMREAAQLLGQYSQPGQFILDIPAGNGKFADALRTRGYQVTCADINQERSDYVRANMETVLPFSDQLFDVVTCMEGVEHTLNPSLLISELSRVTRDHGYVLITMPNVQNYYSRLQFLFTGQFYQFAAESSRHPRGEVMDRGHVSALSYTQLNYLCVDNNLRPIYIGGDRFKKKILLPVYVLLAMVNSMWLLTKIIKRKQSLPYRHMLSWKFFLSRSVIGVWQKNTFFGMNHENS